MRLPVFSLLCVNAVALLFKVTQRILLLCKFVTARNV